jgi:hypothetical protein
MGDKTRVETTRSFLQLSEALTGYSSADLLGTGLLDTYYNEVRDIVGGRIFGRLLLTWDETSSLRGEHDACTHILGNPMLGPIARNIITMWYVGNWTQLPREWRQKYGAHARDLTRVISAEAFQEGLVWDAIGAHPPTAKSPGFGTWAAPPDGAEKYVSLAGLPVGDYASVMEVAGEDACTLTWTSTFTWTGGQGPPDFPTIMAGILAGGADQIAIALGLDSRA